MLPKRKTESYFGARMDYYWNERTDPAYNLALEEVMTAQADAPFAMLWRNRPAVIIGRNQNAFREFDSAYAREHGISVVRRMTGGGAVYHDLGNLNYSIFAFETDANRRYIDFAPFAEPVLSALRALGVASEFSGRNDILVGGRKVSGSAKCVHAGRILFHGTLLFDVDFDAMAAVLTPPRAKIEAKGVASVRARVANLNEFLPGMTRETFRKALGRELLRQFGLKEALPIPENWIREAERIADERYRSWDWNFGESPDFAFERTRRFPCGTVTVHLDVHSGMIRRAAFRGDFFGTAPADELSALLVNCPHRADAIRAALSGADIGRYVAGLELDQLTELLAP
ncbi:MAG: lipoate--protein ligase [Lentisphaeria bacterium]|nr:lipoate--protein ligase [Lentisphaeria bacterium]